MICLQIEHASAFSIHQWQLFVRRIIELIVDERIVAIRWLVVVIARMMLICRTISEDMIGTVLRIFSLKVTADDAWLFAEAILGDDFNVLVVGS